MNEWMKRQFKNSIALYATKNERKNLYIPNDNEKYFEHFQMRHSSTCDSFKRFKYNYLMFSIFPSFAPLFITFCSPACPRAFQMVQKFRKVNVRCLFVILSGACSISWYYAELELNDEEHFKIGKSRFVFFLSTTTTKKLGTFSTEWVR